MPAGMVKRAVIRTPSDIVEMNDALSLRATDRASSGWKVVAIETPRRPCGSTKNVNAAK